jgi:hypothetical protein
MKMRSILQGAYDFHVHCSPDVIPRAQDLLEIAGAARQAGLGGILLKDHTTSTVGRAYAVNRIMKEEVRFLSSLVLNPPVGGLNPSAVESALRSGADVIFFPTYGARHHIAVWGAGKPPTAFPLGSGDRIGVTLMEEGDRLKPVCREILKMIAEHDAILATGHVSPEESLALLRSARDSGVTRMIVTHASESVTRMSPSQQKAAVAMGALIEHCFFAVTPSCPGAIRLEEMAEQIRGVGVEHAILSSDFGQVANGPVVEGFTHYLGEMLRLGFSEAKLRVMIVDNPARLLRGRDLFHR